MSAWTADQLRDLAAQVIYDAGLWDFTNVPARDLGDFETLVRDLVDTYYGPVRAGELADEDLLLLRHLVGAATITVGGMTYTAAEINELD